MIYNSLVNRLFIRNSTLLNKSKEIILNILFFNTFINFCDIIGFKRKSFLLILFFLVKLLEANKIDGEILIADNGSTDKSIEIAKQHGANIIQVKEKGYGSTLIQGTKKAKGMEYATEI